MPVDAGSITGCSPPPQPYAGASLPVPSDAVADIAGEGMTPQVAVAPDGSAIVAWRNAQSVMARPYVAGKWADAATIATPGPYGTPGYAIEAAGPVIAAGTGGSAVVLYYEHHGSGFGICAREFSPSGGWSQPTLLGTSLHGTYWQDPAFPHMGVAFDATGSALAVFIRGKGEAVARRYSAASGWGSPTHIGSATLDGRPALSMHADGTAVAAWRYDPANGGMRVSGTASASGWGATLDLENDFLGTTLAADDNDATLLLRGVVNGSSSNVEINSRSASGMVDPGVKLDTVAKPSDLLLAADEKGLAVAAWKSSMSGCPSNVSVRDSSGNWSTAAAISSAALGVSDISAAAGRAVAVGNDCAQQSLQAVFFENGWQKPLIVEPAHGPADARIALGGSGRALVAWDRSTPLPYIVLARWVTAP